MQNCCQNIFNYTSCIYLISLRYISVGLYNFCNFKDVTHLNYSYFIIRSHISQLFIWTIWLASLSSFQNIVTKYPARTYPASTLGYLFDSLKTPLIPWLFSFPSSTDKIYLDFLWLFLSKLLPICAFLIPLLYFRCPFSLPSV